jgi:hypothetical protein
MNVTKNCYFWRFFEFSKLVDQRFNWFVLVKFFFIQSMQMLNKLKQLSKKVHEFFSPLMVVVLLISIITASVHVSYKFIFGIRSPNIFMNLHQGRISSTIGWTRVPYTIFFFLTYLIMILTGTN